MSLSWFRQSKALNTTNRYVASMHRYNIGTAHDARVVRTDGHGQKAGQLIIMQELQISSILFGEHHWEINAGGYYDCLYLRILCY